MKVQPGHTTLTLRLTIAEHAELEALCDQAKVSKAAFVRAAIKAGWAPVTVPPPVIASPAHLPTSDPSASPRRPIWWRQGKPLRTVADPD